MYKLKKTILVIIMVGVIGLSSIGMVFATTETELNNKKNSIDEQIAETNSEIAGVKNKMTDALTQINELNSQISSYEKEIANLEIQIDNFNTQIEEKESNIQEQEKKYEERVELFEKRLVALYESGSTTYLDVLLGSESLYDFISKYYLISEIAEYDQELIQKIEDTKKQIQNEKVELENSKQLVENSKETMEMKKNSLAESIKDKNNLINTLTAEEKELNKQLEQFETDKKTIQNELARIAKEDDSNKVSNSVTSNSSSTNKSSKSAPSSYGYIFPISGLSKANINNKNYPSYPGHNGIDINIGVVGKNVIAVKDGTVEISTALRNSDGSYRSYGEYITINHHDGTQTVYAHLLSGSRKVSQGQEVSQGQIIGTVGSTGNSTGPHLHFGVYINETETFVNPLPYLP